MGYLVGHIWIDLDLVISVVLVHLFSKNNRGVWQMRVHAGNGKFLKMFSAVFPLPQS
jgi:hypothetical protein